MINLKKYISKCLLFLIVAANIFSVLCFGAYSNNTEQNPFYNVSCTYDHSAKTVKLEYRMKSEDVKKYSDKNIFVYSLPVNTYPEYIEENGLEPISEALTASNRSTVEIKISNLEERLSAFVLAIDTGEGLVYSEIVIPRLGGVAVNSSFKGVDSADAAYVTESSAGTAVLKVNTDLLDGGSSGYLYSVGDRTYTFSSTYVSELDRMMKIYRGIGCDVYLKLVSEIDPTALLSSNYLDQRDVYAYTSFLCSRYQTDEYGGLAGIIPAQPYFDGTRFLFKEYAASLYAAAVALEDSDILCPLILPLSGNVSKMKSFLTDFGNISLQYGLPAVTVMIESNRTPFGIDDGITEAIDSGELFENTVDKDFNSGYVSPENISSFETYIKAFSNRNGCVFPTMIYSWTPSEELGRNAAVAAYVYSYYELYFESNVTTYIVSFDSINANGDTVEGLTEAIRYIDSDLNTEYIDNDKILKYFGFSDWESGINGFRAEDIAYKTVKKNKLKIEKPTGITGVYNYFDFSSVSEMSGWFAGTDCVGISSGKTEHGKGLTARFSTDSFGGGFIAYSYKYSESFKYTDVISIDLSFDAVEKTASNDAEYGVYIILGGEDFRYEYVAEGFSPTEKYTVYADVSRLTESNEVKYIQIGSFADADASDEYRMHIYSINAESLQYNDKELAELIESERERLKSDENTGSINRVAIAFVIVSIVITALIMIMVSRKAQRGESLDSKDQN